jgi:hypothetical protein
MIMAQCHFSDIVSHGQMMGPQCLLESMLISFYTAVTVDYEVHVSRVSFVVSKRPSKTRGTLFAELQRLRHLLRAAMISFFQSIFF